MKTKVLLAGMLLTGGAAMADTAPTMPNICKTTANYGAQAANFRFNDQSWGDPNDPDQLTVKKDFKTYPITAVKFLGNCDDDPGNVLKESWCHVAGGSPDVYQVDVGQVQDKDIYPMATVIVTYNRGGCRVDEVDVNY